jgi:aryl-alcohol dehydrogenase-like predicted oxidoreductase
MEETVRAMHTLIEQGKVLYWGTSHFSALEIMEMYSAARQFGLTPPTIEQPLYNMFDREKVEKEFSRLYDEIGLGTTVFSPLAGGVLTGKYSNGIPEGSRMSLEDFEFMRKFYASDGGKPCIEKARNLKPIAEDLGISLAQLALAWILKNRNVSTIILGASRPDQITENLGALAVVGQLTDDVLARIEGVLDNKPV